ncbi:MAG: TIGR02147 family protein [Fibrobacter sp.]|nr:TIGR02147 family protein [Fibrobacter sp.]
MVFFNRFCVDIETICPYIINVKTMDSIYSYLDYRLFIKDWYAAQASSEKPLSYRAIAASVGFNSPAHITMVLKGKANLSAERVTRFARLLKLKKGKEPILSY